MVLLSHLMVLQKSTRSPMMMVMLRLLLGKENWELIDEELGSDPDVAPDMPHGRRGKRSSSKGTREGKTGTPQMKVFDMDGNLVYCAHCNLSETMICSLYSGSRDPPKKRGRPNGVRSSNNESNTDSLVGTSASLKRKGAVVTEERPKYGGNFRKENSRLTRSTAKAKDDVVKANKDEACSTKSVEDIEETPRTDGKFKKESSRLTRSSAKAKNDVVKARNKDEADNTKNASESNDRACSEDDNQ